MNINILQQFTARKGQIAVLIDPEKNHTEEQLMPLIQQAIFAKIDYFFVGGSTVSRAQLEQAIQVLKANTHIPVVIFPGDAQQISDKADAILFLSLVSGRNPDYLISHHIQCAEEVIDMQLEVIPTAYLLVDGGTNSSVAYVSQTTPIPTHQQNIAYKTAIAAYLQGKQVIYFDAGSGAKNSVPTNFITKLTAKIDTPIIVGGGIRSIDKIQAYQQAGANIIVIGNHLETNIDFLLDIEKHQQSTLRQC